MRRFDIGDKIRCYESGVRGICVKFYTPTACEEQTMVETADGRFSPPPTRTWEKTDKIYLRVCRETLGYHQYVIQFMVNCRKTESTWSWQEERGN